MGDPSVLAVVESDVTTALATVRLLADIATEVCLSERSGSPTSEDQHRVASTSP